MPMQKYTLGVFILFVIDNIYISLLAQQLNWISDNTSNQPNQAPAIQPPTSKYWWHIFLKTLNASSAKQIIVALLQNPFKVTVYVHALELYISPNDQDTQCANKGSAWCFNRLWAIKVKKRAQFLVIDIMIYNLRSVWSVSSPLFSCLLHWRCQHSIVWRLCCSLGRGGAWDNSKPDLQQRIVYWNCCAPAPHAVRRVPAYHPRINSLGRERQRCTLQRITNHNPKPHINIFTEHTLINHIYNCLRVYTSHNNVHKWKAIRSLNYKSTIPHLTAHACT